MVWVAAGAAFLAMALAIGSVICSPKVGFREDPENPGFGLIGVVGGSEKWSKTLAVGSALLGGLSGVLGVFAAT
jgi:hypothetical protein